MAADRKGQVYVAWIAFEDGKDRVRVARLASPIEQKPSVAAQWDVPIPDGGDVETISLCGDQEGAFLVASCEIKGNWEIVLSRVTEAGPSNVTVLTDSAATDVAPMVACCAGTPYLTWESNRDGGRQIYVGKVAEGKLTDVRRLSTSEGANDNPVIASDETGGWIVWESFRENNYDIYGVRLQGSEWGRERRLTSDPRVEHRPFVAMRGGEAWIAWEMVTFPLHAATGTYRTSSSSEQRTLVAQITDPGLVSTPGAYDLFPNWTGHPTLAFDEGGVLWAAARSSRGKNAGWDVMVRRFDGKGWSPAQPTTAAQGRAQRAPTAVAGNQVLVAVQTDTIPGKWDSVEASKTAVSNVELCSLRSQGSATRSADLAALALPATDFTLSPMRAKWGEDSPKRSIEYQGEKLNLYFGQFHEHTEISVCNRRGDLPPEDNYIHNRDIHSQDFSAITDHGYDIAPQIWHYTGKLARTQSDPGRFLAFLAEEWTSTFEKYSAEHPYGYYGHRNLVFADPHFPRWFNAMEADTPAQVWSKLRETKANFIHIPHQLADTGNVPTDWNFTDETAQPIAEIFQSRQSYEYKGCPRQAKSTADGYFIQDAWAKGIIIGVIASPDHGGAQGKAAIYAPELTREAILDACRARHTYGTSGGRIFLDARVNGRLMGEKLPAQPGPVEVTAQVIAAGDIDRVEVCRNNQFIYSVQGKGREATFKFSDTNPLETTAYYYVRVVQKDGELAWSSPVWLTR
jgi:hypothetical protein